MLNKIIDYYSASRKWNPNFSTIDEPAAKLLSEIEGKHYDKIVKFIYESRLVDEYLTIRELKWAEGDYIALPFNAIPALGACKMGQVGASRPLHCMLSHVVGWTILVQVEPGVSPQFDGLYQQLESYLDDRTAELESVLATL